MTVEHDFSNGNFCPFIRNIWNQRQKIFSFLAFNKFDSLGIRNLSMQPDKTFIVSNRQVYSFSYFPPWSIAHIVQVSWTYKFSKLWPIQQHMSLSSVTVPALGLALTATASGGIHAPWTAYANKEIQCQLKQAELTKSNYETWIWKWILFSVDTL